MTQLDPPSQGRHWSWSDQSPGMGQAMWLLQGWGWSKALLYTWQLRDPRD